MRDARKVILDSREREIIQRHARSRSLPARIVERSRIVLLAADGLQNKQVAYELRITPEKAARWRNRFLNGGVAALEKDAPRPGRRPKISVEKVNEVVFKTTQEAPQNAVHWSTRAMARAVGVSEATVRRIWHSHGLS